MKKFLSLSISCIAIGSIISSPVIGAANSHLENKSLVSNRSQNVGSYSDYPTYFNPTPSFTDSVANDFNHGLSGIDASGLVENRFWSVDDRGRNFTSGTACRSLFAGAKDNNNIVATSHSFTINTSGATGSTSSVDFEDMDIITDSSSSTGSSIYIGDIGDNGKSRARRAIYIIDEPTAPNGSTNCTGAVTSKVFVYKYALDKKNDVEAMFVDPVSKDVYFIVKSDGAGNSNYRLRRLYKVNYSDYSTKLFTPATLPTSPSSSQTATAHDLGFIFMDWADGDENSLKQITSADMSSDGKQLLISTYNEAYIWNLHNRSISSITTTGETETFNAKMPLPWTTGVDSNNNPWAFDAIEAISFSNSGQKVLVVEESRSNAYASQNGRYFEFDLTNQQPTVANDTVTTDTNMSVQITPLSNDSDPDNNTLHLISYTQPENGVVTENGNGLLTYTPNSGFTGVDTFTYVVGDLFENGVYYYNIPGNVTISVGEQNVDLTIIRPTLLWNRIYFGESTEERIFIHNQGSSLTTSFNLELEWASNLTLTGFMYKTEDMTNFQPFNGTLLQLENLSLDAGSSYSVDIRFTPPLNNLAKSGFINSTISVINDADQTVSNNSAGQVYEVYFR